MSLINDALKRASTKPDAPRPDLPQAVPVTDPAPDQRKAGAVPIAALAALAVLLVVVFLWMRSSKPDAVQAKAPAPAAAQETPAQPESSGPAVVQAMTKPLQNAAAVANTISAQNAEGAAAAQVIAAPAQNPPPAQARAAAPEQPAPAGPPPVQAAAAAPPEATTAVEPPSFRLQAIFFRMNNPTVVINGKTLAHGEAIDGATVAEIRRSEVEIEVNGQRQTLALK